MSKRIVISANTSWYLYNFRKNTISAMLAKGFEVITLAPLDEYSCKLETLGASHVNLPIDRGGVNPIADLRTLVSIFFVLKKYKPKVIFNFTPKCFII